VTLRTAGNPGRPDGEPPYVVEWSDVEGEHTIWPGADAAIEHVEHHLAPDAAKQSLPTSSG
jgi:hypothetical protein